MARWLRDPATTELDVVDDNIDFDLCVRLDSPTRRRNGLRRNKQHNGRRKEEEEEEEN